VGLIQRDSAVEEKVRLLEKISSGKAERNTLLPLPDPQCPVCTFSRHVGRVD